MGDLILLLFGYVVLPFIVNCASTFFMNWLRNRKN